MPSFLNPDELVAASACHPSQVTLSSWLWAARGLAVFAHFLSIPSGHKCSQHCAVQF